MKNRRNSLLETDVIVWTNNTGATVKPGDDLGKEGVVRIGGRYGIAMQEILNTKSGTVLVKGEVEVAKAAGVAFAVGDRLGWNAAAKEVTTALSGGTILIVTRAALSADLTVIGELADDDTPGWFQNVGVASAIITNTVAPTKFDQRLTIPANSLRAGDEIEIEGMVDAVSTNATDTLTLKAFIGNTEICATPAVDVANGDKGIFKVKLVVRTIGAGGTFVAGGTAGLGPAATGTMRPVGKASTVIDTTVAQEIALEATWSVANAGNQARQEILGVKVNRPGSALA